MSQYLDLSPRDRAEYSFVRVVESQLAGLPSSGTHQEAHDELRRRGVTGPGLQVPLDMVFERDLNASTGSAGGYLVGTTTATDSLQPAIQAASIVVPRVQVITDLKGQVTVPFEKTQAGFNWRPNETQSTSESNPAFGQLALVPKAGCAYVECSRQWLQQSNAEQLLRSLIARRVGRAMDAAAINGSGINGEPLGILATPGIGTFSGSSLGLTGLQNGVADVGDALDGSTAFITTLAVAQILQARMREASTFSPCWTGSVIDGQVLGLPAAQSSNVPAATAILGSFNRVVIGVWSMSIDVNPFANFQAGIVGIRCWLEMDIGVAAPAAFSVAASIT